MTELLTVAQKFLFNVGHILMDAEDLIQDAWMKWNDADHVLSE